jgi:hypothetical protein
MFSPYLKLEVPLEAFRQVTNMGNVIFLKDPPAFTAENGIK